MKIQKCRKKSHHFLTLWPWPLTYDLEKLIRSGHYHYQCVYRIWEQSIPWFLSYRVNTIAGGGRLRRKTITSPDSFGYGGYKKSINWNLSQYQKTTFQGIPTVNIRQPGDCLIENRALAFREWGRNSPALQIFTEIRKFWSGVLHNRLPGHVVKGAWNRLKSTSEWLSDFNSLAPGKFEWNFIYVIFKPSLVIDGWGISLEIALIWLSLDFTNDQSILVQVIAWCCQWVGVGGFFNLVATFNHVGGSFRIMCCMLRTFHVLSWIMANISQSSLLLSQQLLRFCWRKTLPGNYYAYLETFSSKFSCSRLLSLYSFLLLFFFLTFFRLVYYCSMWLYFGQGTS